jgi:hypothetical protein
MSMGLTAASLGVSGLVFAQINDFFFKSNTHDDDSVYSFILFYASTGAVILVIGSFILGPLPDAPVQQEERLVEDYVSTISSMSSSSTRVEESRPLLNNKIISADNINQDYDEPSLSGVAFFADPIAFALTGALLVILGLGYIYLANIGQLLLSLSTLEQRADASGLQHLRNMHVSLFSISNCLSRCFFGALSDILDRKLGIHRIWLFWMASIGLVLNLLYLVTGISNTDELVPCTIFTAVLYGNVFGVAPAAVSEFGTKVCVFTL